MKKGVVIFFILIYATSLTKLNEFLKLPLLFEHFKEHRSQNTKLTFIDFLSMHYSQENDHDGDQEKDNKLPFKSHSFSFSNFSFVTLPATQNIQFNFQNEFKEQRSILSFYKFFISSSHLKAIWQPPQIN